MPRYDLFKDEEIIKCSIGANEQTLRGFLYCTELEAKTKGDELIDMLGWQYIKDNFKIMLD